MATTIRAAKLRAMTEFRKLLGKEVAVGVVNLKDGQGLKVNLSEPPGDVELPSEIDGYPVEVAVVGHIKKL
jgi:hypothetical protein